MTLETLIEKAYKRGASDLHVEAGLEPRVGSLQSIAGALPARDVTAMVRAVLGEAAWSVFLERGSLDLSRHLAGARCRINVLRTSRGVGLAIRLLPGALPSVRSLNLHPDVAELIRDRHGLVIVSGPTGSGKSSTLAALVQLVNQTSKSHILTLESPIEYALRPQLSLVRQREIGRDSPSFEQALIDAMREDPDVIMVGEMREPETMRLTLHAAETGHLVLTTLHSGTVVDALQRIVAAFPAEVQPSVQNQLADCLRAVVCQRLTFRSELGIRVPECEILRATHAVRGVIRQGSLYKLSTVIDTGGNEGQWSVARYRAWVDRHQDWAFEPDDPEEGPDVAAPDDPQLEADTVRPTEVPAKAGSRPAAEVPPAPPMVEEDVIVLHEPEGSLQDILSELKED
jgi:twitching motility protein PilT